MDTIFSTVNVSIFKKVATITLNRPANMNAVNTEMRADLLAALRSLSSDDSISVILITGAGKHFGAGQDLSDVDNFSQGVTAIIEGELKPIIMEIHLSPKPVISAINGACIGVSASIALASDLCIMADNAFLHVAFSGIGCIPDGGLNWQLVNQIGYKRAYKIILEGGKITAQECLNLGLVNKLTNAESLYNEALTWAEELSLGAPIAQRYTKEVLRSAMAMSLSETMSVEAILQHNCITSEDSVEAVRAFNEKRRPIFSGK